MGESTSERILKTLAELGGKQFSEDSITFEGTRLVIPKTMTAHEAIRVLQSHIAAEETEHEFERKFRFRPWDVAAATARAIKTLTGTSGIGLAQHSFFGSTPPSMKTIEVGVGETLQVPWGSVWVELLKGTVTISGVKDPEYGLLGYIGVEAPRKMRAAVEGLFKMIEDELNRHSIYRGKAFNGNEVPEFIDLDTVDPSQVIYTKEVTAQLDANVWSMLRYTEAMRRNGVPMKRSVLLHGPFGTGKTLAAFLTAREAVANGWTFIYCRPAKDDLHEVMQTARLYQPSVVFFEDVDTISSGGDDDSVSKLLDTFDGITAKGTELIVMLTTNHPERIHKGMVRPGRLDAVIEISSLDRDAFERMIQATVPEEFLDEIDYDKVAEAMEGFLPAFVKEAIDRTKRYAIARNAGELTKLTTDDFVHAANGLRPQLEMMNEAKEGVKTDKLGDVLKASVREAIERQALVDERGDEVLWVGATR